MERNRLSWVRHIKMMRKDRIPKTTEESKEKGKRQRDKPWMRCFDDSDLDRRGISWYKVSENNDGILSKSGRGLFNI